MTQMTFYTRFMDSERKTAFVRGRVTPTVRAQIGRLVDLYGTTSEDLLGALVAWFVSLQDDDERRRILAGLSDQALIKLARRVQAREATTAAEIAAAAVERAAAAQPETPPAPPRRKGRARG